MACRLLLPLLLALLLVPAGASPLGAAEQPEAVHHELRVRLDPARRELQVDGVLTLPGSGSAALRLDRRFAVEALSLDGGRGGIAARGPGAWTLALGAAGRHEVRIRYRGRLDPLTPLDHRAVLGRLPPMADPKGSYLPAGAGWHPEVPGRLMTYRVTLDLPAGQRGLVAGRLVGEREESGRAVAVFDSEQPAEDLALLAGPYTIRERTLRLPSGAPVRLRTYFHPELADLAGAYLASAEAYLLRYSRMIGDYPFGGFSVVSSPLPTGFGMPTLTYLGADVVRLPFIRTTSLGHEVLHNWWGNGVYVDRASGNWSEGLTTFLADYAYAEDEGPEAARAMRLAWLRDFAAVPPGEDAPLARFAARTHGTSQVLGYHKAAFLFLMLRDRIGPAAFTEGLRRVWREHRGRAAGWADLQHAFEAAAGQDLTPAFAPWLSRPGAAGIRVEQAQAGPSATGHRVRLVLRQDAPAYPLLVPIGIATEAGEERRRLELAEAVGAFAVELAARPTALALDPDFRLFRRLLPGEAPAILRQVMLASGVVTVPATPEPAVQAAAAGLAARLLDHPARSLPPEARLPEAPLLVVGLRGHVDALLARAGLPPRPPDLPAAGSAQVWAAVTPAGHPMMVVSAERADALQALLRPLPHYGRQSWLVFEGASVLQRGIWPARPPRIPLTP
ncbi:MAG: M1 family metallopeptidase [Candidatus Methylomirabilales bacterium]